MFEISPLRVFIVDDFPVIREGIVNFINSQIGLRVSGQAATYSDARRAFEECLPDLLLIDLVTADGSDGLPFIEEMKARYPKLRVLVFSNHEEEIYAERAIRAGAGGFIMKRESTTEMLVAIRMVAAGDLYVSRKFSSELAKRLLQPETNRDGIGIDSFTDRELHVFRLIGAGLSPRKIAMQMGLSVRAVEAHRENIRTKLDVHTFADVVALAETWVNERIA